MPNLLDESEFKAEWSRLEQDFNSTKSTIENNRKIRKNKVDVIAMRRRGLLNPSQTYVGVRVIDENIQRDVPTYLAFLKQARRMGIFTPLDNPNIQVEPLEMAVTSNLRYNGWETDYIRYIDGALLHGWDIVEVVFDPNRPGHVSVNHVGADNLLFSRQYENIEQSPMVARAYSISAVDLDNYVRNKTFDVPTAVENLKKHIDSINANGKSSDNLAQPTQVYRVLFKHDGIVYETWYSNDVNERLSTSRPFFNGRYERLTTQTLQPGTLQVVPQETFVPTKESQYPYVMFFTSLTEEKRIAEQVGHGERSYYLQDAMCVLQSAGVNGAIQASNVMWSPDGEDFATAGKAALQDLKIKNGAVWNRPMRAFSAPYPDPMLFRALDALDTRNAVSTNKQAFAVNNRQDSRKTAKEIQSAESQQSQISSVQVLFLSIPVREIVRRSYEIMRSEWLRGELTPPFDKALLEQRYEIQSAGDQDYIQRQELIAAMQQDWPVMQATPAAQIFLTEYLQLRYPQLAPKLIASLSQTNDNQLIAGLATTLREAVTDEHGQLKPEFAGLSQQLGLLAQQVQQRLAAGGMAATPGNAGVPQ